VRYLIGLVLFFALIDTACSNNDKYDVQQTPPFQQTEQQKVTTYNQPKQSAQPAKNKQIVEKRKIISKPAYQYPNDNGIGPIKSVKLGPIDPRLVAQGEKIFDTKCMACHRLDSRLVGPPLRGITKKNTPEYIMNYLLNTTEMQKKDPLIKKQVAEYKLLMPDQNLTKEDARAMLEFFRSKDKKKNG